MKHIGPRT